MAISGAKFSNVSGDGAASDSTVARRSAMASKTLGGGGGEDGTGNSPFTVDAATQSGNPVFQIRSLRDRSPESASLLSVVELIGPD